MKKLGSTGKAVKTGKGVPAQAKVGNAGSSGSGRSVFGRTGEKGGFVPLAGNKAKEMGRGTEQQEF